MSYLTFLRLGTLVCLAGLPFASAFGQGALTDTLTNITIVGPAAPLVVGDPQSFTFTATGIYTVAPTVRKIGAGLEWKSDDTAVLTVDKTTGVAKAIGKGTTTVRAFDPVTATGEGFPVTVTVPAAPTLVDFTLSAPETVVVGSPIQIAVSGQYQNAAPPPTQTTMAPDTLTWAVTPADGSVATVVKGLVTGVLAGKSVTVTATIASTGAGVAAISRTVTLNVVAATASKPHIWEKLVAGSKNITVMAPPGHTLSVYQFDEGTLPSVSINDCGGYANLRTLLQVVTAANPLATASSITIDSTHAANIPYNLTLVQPLVARTNICIADTPPGGTAAATWSDAGLVIDPDDYGRVRTYFVAGVQVTNQQSAAASSTAGQYLEAGFNYTWIRAKDKFDVYPIPKPATTGEQASTCDQKKGKPCPTVAVSRYTRGRTPGLSTNLDIRLSPIPVSTPATTTVPGTATTPTISTTNPNLLTSQQSARVVGMMYAPWKMTRWNNHSDYLTVGPAIRGGFATLLNPTVNNGVATGSSATSSVTTATFSSAYNFIAYGARFGWDRYASSTDKSPRTITQFVVSMGGYSNLPSYQCKASATPVTPTPAPTPPAQAATSCGLAGSSNQNLPVLSRTLVPRLDIEGFAQLPNFPFVLGIDANLAQYTMFGRSNIDYLSKPGNDIRIFIGFRLDVGSLIGKFGVPTS